MIPVITGTVGLCVAALIILLIRKDRLHVQQGLGWIIVAIGFSLLGFSPRVIDWLSSHLGVANPPILALMLGIIIGLIACGVPVAFAFLTADVVGVLIFMMRSSPTPSRRLEGVRNLVLLAGSSVLVLLMLEAGFSLFDVRSDNFVRTLAAQRWMARYWQPINFLGYRDAEYSPGTISDKRVVAVVGDSFTAGAGIEDHRDRYPDVLAELLGFGWKVMNISHGGWGPTEELRALEKHPITPDVIVLQYYINDIRRAASTYGADPLVHLERPTGVLGAIIENSFFVNFAYWRLYRLKIKRSGRAFWEDIVELYQDERIWNDHVLELENFVQYAQQVNADLVVVVFPFLLRVEETAPITAKVSAVFERMGVTVIDLAPIFSGRDPSELIVHSMDAHPNERVHREVAEVIWKRGEWTGR